MSKIQKSESTGAGQSSCCRVEALISVDERGQMVLPKELREKAGIGPGDKLAVSSLEQNGKTCCIILIKAEGLAEMMRAMMSPLVKDLS